ncbi:FadD3 family acyl-CoA ligase [Pseudonocardia humida]|uniref:FadD3 family acyl-CoA ligase n=1 Tax=Pseudonocardia humida TaxID=2800819 RepID=A0ABT0ZXM6_9PSEU|nr:FadD3 family acyl-CoA ligase [Pseudonocardia humida]MCO1655497.1 FadD3 family acyl-CoA ligase [Pseudonocardia humida]
MTATGTVPDVLVRAAERHGDREAIVDGELRLSFADLLAEVERVAAGLLRHGLRAGDAVAVWAPNSARWALAALGCLHVGLTLVPVNTRYRGEEAHHVLARSRAVALFVEDGFLDRDHTAMLRAAGPLPCLRTVVTLGEPRPSGPIGWDAFRARAADPAQVAAARDAVTPGTAMQVMFTSGTTGRPKAVPHTHGQVVRLYTTYTEHLGLRAGDRYLLVNPFFHSFGLLAGLLSCLLRGATALPVRRLDPPAVLELVERERVTGIPGPPTLYATLLNDPTRPGRDLSALRLAITGATVIPTELIRRMRTDLGFREILTAYGLTESTGVVTMCRIGDPDEVIESTSGRAVEGVEVAIAALHGGDGGGGTGEILVRGYNVMAGYVDDPGATAAAIDADGWLRTGDVGHLDGAGNLHITGRLGDVFIVGGFNVSPAEVEQLLCRHPAVSEAAVVGVPDERLGEVGRAFVVLRRGAAPAAEAELIAWCRERLAGFKVPRSVVVLPELPKGATGKVAKAALRAPAP